MWSYLAAAAREQRARQERDELAAELAEKQGKGRAAEFLERIGFVGRLATYLVFFGLFAIWYPDVSEAACRGERRCLGVSYVVAWDVASCRSLAFPTTEASAYQAVLGGWTICLSVVAVVIATYFGWIRW
jgi:hypothetical protein